MHYWFWGILLQTYDKAVKILKSYNDLLTVYGWWNRTLLWQKQEFNNQKNVKAFRKINTIYLPTLKRAKISSKNKSKDLDKKICCIHLPSPCQSSIFSILYVFQAYFCCQLLRKLRMALLKGLGWICIIFFYYCYTFSSTQIFASPSSQNHCKMD